MTPDEIRQLRQGLQCTARELAATLGIDHGEVTAWEQGDRFPTKKMVAELSQLRELGPSAILRQKKQRGANHPPRLADPEFWQLVRKLIEHADLFEQVKRLAEAYPDSTVSPKQKP